MSEALFHIALVEPEIPQNTGNIGRLSLGVGARLHLVKPLGFDISEKAVRRAGLDYWKNVDLQIHENQAEFIAWMEQGKHTAFMLSTKATESLAQVRIPKGSVLVFGPETRGLSEEMRSYSQTVKIPMTGNIRSYNLSNSVAIAAYYALSQISPDWL